MGRPVGYGAFQFVRKSAMTPTLSLLFRIEEGFPVFDFFANNSHSAVKEGFTQLGR